MTQLAVEVVTCHLFSNFLAAPEATFDPKQTLALESEIDPFRTLKAVESGFDPFRTLAFTRHSRESGNLAKQTGFPLSRG